MENTEQMDQSMGENPVVQNLSNNITNNVSENKNRGFRETLKSAWARYMSGFKALLKLQIVATLITIGIFIFGSAFTVLGAFLIRHGGGAYLATGALSIIIALALFCIAVYAMINFTIALTIQVQDIEKVYGIKEIFKKSRTYLRGMTLTVLLKTFVVMGAIMLFIIPGIWISVLLSLITFVVLRYNVYGFEAIDYSVALVDGYWWNTFKKFGLLIILFILIGLPFNLINMVAHDTAIGMLFSFIYNVISWLLITFTIAFRYEIFSDLVKQKGSNLVVEKSLFARAMFGFVLVVILFVFIFVLL